MAPLAFKVVYLFLALVALPQALAGPGCARRNYGKQDCVEKCKDGWGVADRFTGAFVCFTCLGQLLNLEFQSLKAVTSGDL